MPTIDLPLTPAGPIITVCIHQSAHRMRAMFQAGHLNIPTFFLGKGLIDSGASVSVIDDKVVAHLGLTPTGSVPIHTPSTGKIPVACDSFDISLWFIETPTGGSANLQVHGAQIHPIHLTLPVISTDLSASGIDALIGRDVLDQCHFSYDGKNQRFILVYGP